MNHVNHKLIAGLAGAALLAIGAAVWVTTSRQPAAETTTSEYALPGLNGQINAVKSVAIVGAETKTLVTLDHGEQGWTVREKGGYPADTGKLRELLLNLADAKLLAAKTANPERYAELGVEDPHNQDAKGVLIKMEGVNPPLALIVGNASSHGGGTFVRRPAEAQSWLASGQFGVEREPAQWLNTALTDIASERIAEVVLTPAGGQPLRLIKTQRADADFRVENIPAGRELATPGVANALASTLAGLTLEDVAAATGASLEPTPNLAKYRTFDGLTIQVTAWQKDGKSWARFEVSFDEAAAEQALQAELAEPKAAEDNKPSDGRDDTEQQRRQRLDGLRNEAAQLKQRLAGWQFALPAYKYANMTKGMDALLKPAASTAGGQRH
ncbi:hypothetical protein A1507_11840 [Methylomonas koyamae]|uniref:DUF4340 domain-containing protein n=1 Tax=Methylomonas koyamae TaxID=702114 RepID=A0A177NF43_9GAMM|nr:DUF4340 domain-containing protein [Methylomonas koyamae]OAI16244.1 hypothetical protein A1507_11840 [Methylomonas koyamae]